MIPSSFGCSQPRVSGAAAGSGSVGQRWPFQAQALGRQAAELKESGGQVRPPPTPLHVLGCSAAAAMQGLAGPLHPSSCCFTGAAVFLLLPWQHWPEVLLRATADRLQAWSKQGALDGPLQKVDLWGLLRGRKGHGIETAPRVRVEVPRCDLVVEILGLVGPLPLWGP